MKNRIVLALVCVCILLTLLSAAASAAGTGGILSVSPESLSFEAVYGELPVAQAVTIQNTSDYTLHLNLMGAEDFVVSALSQSVLEPDDTAVFTVQPEKGLAVGTYEANLTIRESGASVFWLPLSYTVKASSQKAASVTVDEAKHGSVSVSSKTAAAGDTVTVTVSADSGYTLETLTVSDGFDSSVELSIVKLGKTYTFQMPSSGAAVSATFMEDNSVLNNFVDVPTSAYYFDAVKWASENNITGGVGNYRFGPNETCTRAQIVTFLWRAAGQPAPESRAMRFTDVKTSSYYADAVRWAVENGITTGTSKTTFGPNERCTRAQIVAFLYRSEQISSGGMTDAWSFRNPFIDVDTESYYGEAVMWAVANGITGGTSSTRFSPNAACTRAQVVTFLWRAMAN